MLSAPARVSASDENSMETAFGRIASQSFAEFADEQNEDYCQSYLRR